MSVATGNLLLSDGVLNWDNEYTQLYGTCLVMWFTMVLIVSHAYYTLLPYDIQLLMSNVISFICRLLFPDQPQLVDEMIQSSGVNPNHRAQQLDLVQFEKLCLAYKALVTSPPSSQEHTHQIMS